MATTQTVPKKKGLINFDFLQKLGKVLMTVIAVMPAAGLMISLGKLVQMGGGDIAAVMTIGTTMENIGWAVINNLAHPLRRGHRRQLGKRTRRRCLLRLCWPLRSSMSSPATSSASPAPCWKTPTPLTHTLFGQEIAVNGYFTSVLGASGAEHGRVRGHHRRFCGRRGVQ